MAIEAAAVGTGMRDESLATAVDKRSRLNAARLLCAALALIGLAGYLFSGWETDLGAALSSPATWILGIVFCIAERYTFDIPFKSHRHSFSMAEIPTVVGMFFLPPDAFILAGLVGEAVTFFFLRGQRWLKFTFNMSQQFSMFVVQLLVFETIAGPRPDVDATGLVAAYVAIGISALLSHSSVTAVISFVEGLWDNALFMRGLWFGVATQMASASLGLVGVLLLDIDWRAIFILLTPIFVLYVAYKSLGQRIVAEEKLRVSERRFAALIQASSDVTALVGTDGMLQYVSAAATHVLGIDPSDALGREVSVLVGPDESVTKLVAGIDKVAGSAEPVMFALSCRHPDGSDIQLEVGLTNLLSDPAVEAILMSIRDVSDRRRLEERLTQSQKMDAIGQLAGGIAHDFNNLLAVIQNYANFVRSDLPADSQSIGDVDEIVSATETASGLTKQLLSFARKEIVTPKVVSVNHVVSGMHRMFVRTIEESIELRTELAADIPSVKIDPVRLEQLLVNLAVNAKDAMPEGGELTIGTEATYISDLLACEDLPEGRYVIVTFQDSGVGIRPELRERIFEPFFTTKATGEGTGLGLATVYGIVKQFGGHIEVDSELGKGSTFRIFLPATDQPADEATALSPDHPRGRGTILLAEDSEPLRKLVQRILTNQSYRVYTAATGAEAFRLWQAHMDDIDLLVTDVVMPKMSGRELSELTGLPTVFTSGYTDQIISQEDLSNGGFFLPKPFSADDLLSVVGAAIADSAVAVAVS